MPKRVLCAFVAAVLVSAVVFLQRGQRLVPVGARRPTREHPASDVLDDIGNSTLGVGGGPVAHSPASARLVRAAG